MAVDDDSGGEKAKNRSILAEAASILFLLSAIVSLFLFFSLSSLPPSPLRDLLSGVVDATDDYYYCSPSIRARMIRQTELDCFSIPLHPSFTLALCALCETGFRKRNKHEY